EKNLAITEDALRAEWRRRAADHRFNLDRIPRIRRTPTLATTDDELALAVTEEHAHYERPDAIRAVAKAARQGATLDEILQRTDDYLASEPSHRPRRWPLHDPRDARLRTVDPRRRR